MKTMQEQSSSGRSSAELSAGTPGQHGAWCDCLTLLLVPCTGVFAPNHPFKG